MTSVVIALALVVSGALVVLTTVLHRTTFSAAASVESIRLAQEAEIDLFLHARATDGLVRRDIEESIQRRLSVARRFVTSEREERAITEAESLVAAYIAAARELGIRPADLAARQEAVYGALEALATLNVAHAREANAAAIAWDKRANYLGIGIAGLLILVAAGVLVWLRRHAFAPVLSLATSMERFGRGDREVRAQEVGPAELRHMSRRFNEMATALARQRQAQVAFLGGVAHDLKNPLSVLKTALALMPSDRPLPPEERLRSMIETIGRQLARLERMTGDFLDMSKIDAGELELQLEVHDARELVSGVVDLFAGTSPEPRLSMSLPDDPAYLLCDQLRIEQVLTNLISNAIKYSPAGSGIEVALEAQADEVVFRVTDQGIGIPEPEQQHVFEPFRRVGLSKGTVPGVGLGLFVVRRLVLAHGGRIEVESAPGAGSTFRFFLPMKRDTTRVEH